jgi:ATP-binding protein involved in chromosome partitioning
MKWPFSKANKTAGHQSPALSPSTEGQIDAILKQHAGDAALESLSGEGGDLHIVLAINPADAGEMETRAKICEGEIGALEGITSVKIVLTAHSDSPSAPKTQAPPPPPPPSSAQPPARPKSGGGHRPLPVGGAGDTEILAGAKKVIAVASGKGGVGKSTVAVNLALALKAKGLVVGLLDADIYGPSFPVMLGVDEKPESDGDKLLPVEAHGLKTMSIGYLAGGKTAMIWRGPMVMGALGQMLGDVDWGELDVMIVDMPPGTGDAHLTLVQKAPLTGVVIVSTPQEVALADARRGIEMFERTGVPILGIIENMSYLEMPGGERMEIFGHGGARKTAEDKGVPFLGEIPLDIKIREHGDSGLPIVVAEPDGAQAKLFSQIAEQLLG